MTTLWNDPVKSASSSSIQSLSDSTSFKPVGAWTQTEQRQQLLRHHPSFYGEVAMMLKADQLPSYAEAVKVTGRNAGGASTFGVNLVEEHATELTDASTEDSCIDARAVPPLVQATVSSNEPHSSIQRATTDAENIAAVGDEPLQRPASSEVPPPSYESLFGRAVREVREESHCGGSGGATRSLSRISKLCCGACDWVLWLVVTLFVPLYCIVISIMYAGHCSGVPFLPMWLLIVGVIPTFKVLVRALARIFKIARQGFSNGFSEPFTDVEKRWMSFGDDYLIM